MRAIGFSSGALAYADFRSGLKMLRQAGNASAVELSALRKNELAPLVAGLEGLDLSAYSYVSLHAPSGFDAAEEPEIVRLLEGVVQRRGWNVVMHPDAIHDFSLWRRLGSRLCIENMDRRKPTGRTVEELEAVFAKLPEASFCLDIGHARQVDSSMTEAYLMLKRFDDRLLQMHVSDVTTSGEHDSISWISLESFREVAEWLHREIPLIIEAPADPECIRGEIQRIQAIFAPARRTGCAPVACQPVVACY